MASKKLSGVATAQEQSVVSETKVSSPVVVEGTDTQMLKQQYDTSMKDVQSGIDKDVYGTGSLAEKRAFVENVFGASMTGKQLAAATGEAQKVPDLFPDANGNVAVVLTEYGSPENAYYTGKSLQASDGLSKATLAPSSEKSSDWFGISKTMRQNNRENQVMQTHEDRVKAAEAMQASVLSGGETKETEKETSQELEA